MTNDRWTVSRPAVRVDHVQSRHCHLQEHESIGKESQSVTVVVSRLQRDQGQENEHKPTQIDAEYEMKNASG